MRAIVEMCRAVNLPVVAEGVESNAQLRQLRELGCQHAQGYLLCHPMPAGEIGAFLQEHLVSGDFNAVAQAQPARSVARAS